MLVLALAGTLPGLGGVLLAQPEAPLDPATQEIRAAVARNDLKAAILAGRRLLPANRDNAAFREQLGGAYYLASVRLKRQGSASATVTELQVAAREHLAHAADLTTGPPSTRVSWTLALLENSLGDPAAAIARADRGLADHPGDVRLLTARAHARTALGDWERATAEWRAIIAAFPEDTEAVIGLGDLLDARGLPCDAADLYLEHGFGGADGPAGRSWRAQYELARVLVSCGRLDATIAPLERAIALEPERAQIAIELAEQYHRAGRSDDALSILEAWIAKETFVDRDLRTTAHYRRARILTNRGDGERARADYETVLANEPAHTGALRGLGMLLLRSDDPTESARGRTLLERFRHHAPLSDEIRVARNNVRRAPERPALRAALIRLLLRVPDPAAARTELEEFGRRFPRSTELPELRAELRDAESAPEEPR